MADSEPQSRTGEVVAPLSQLSLDNPQDHTTTNSSKPVTSKEDSQAKKSKAKKSKVVADSWEDEDLSSSEEDEEQKKPTYGSSGSNAPPLSSPISVSVSPAAHVTGTSRYHHSEPSGPGADRERRPEKTDAVARRMIAAGLGLRAPKQTEEQKEYQKSIREQEKKRREQERLEEQKRKEAVERAKAAIWDD